MASSPDMMKIDPPLKKNETPVPCGATSGSTSDDIHWAEEVAKMDSTHHWEEALLKLCSNYGIKEEEFKPLCAEQGRGPCMPPPEDSNAVCVFEAMLEAGVRFPLHDCYVKVLRHYSLAPSQLAPNAWRYLAGFVLLCEDAEVVPMTAVFRHYFNLKAHQGKLKGFYYFVPYSPNRLLFKSVGTLPSNDGWKKKFFFLKALSPLQPWRCLRKWGTPSKAACNKPVITVAMTTVINKLEEKARKDDVMSLLYKSRDEDRLPVLPGLRAPVKLEASAAAEERALASKRKYKSLAAMTNNLQLLDVPGASPSSPPEFTLVPPVTDHHELSTSQLLMDSCKLLQKKEAELRRMKDELRVERAKHVELIAQHDKDLVAAKAEHTAMVALLTEQLQAEKNKHTDDERDLLVAKVARLAEELQEVKIRRAQLVEELETTKAQHLTRVRQFTEEIQAAKTERDKALEIQEEIHQAEVGQLKDELQAWKAKYAADVGSLQAHMKVFQAAQTQHMTVVCQLREQFEAAKAEHSAKVCELKEELQRYTDGVKAAMRELTIVLHPGGVDTTPLTPDMPSSSSPIAPECASPQAPGDQ